MWNKIRHLSDPNRRIIPAGAGGEKENKRYSGTNCNWRRSPVKEMGDGDYHPLPGGSGDATRAQKDAAAVAATRTSVRRRPRLASLDAFRGLSIALMIFVDYAGSILPVVAHSAWNGLRLADYVMPFFLFIAGVSLSLVHKVSNLVPLVCFSQLFDRGFSILVLLCGYFHGLNDLTYGVDLKTIRWFGILQRIAIGYIVAALCEIWLSRSEIAASSEIRFHKKYYFHWAVILLLCGTYLGLLYGLYVPDWQFKVEKSSGSTISNATFVKCGVRGNVGPACNSAGLIDRSILGIEHLYKKPSYMNLKECQNSESVPSWCLAPFDPEGILGSLMAAVTCIIGLQYGHVLVHFEEHRDRLLRMLWLSFPILAFGLLLAFLGIPLNKSLYTTSYTLVTTATAGFSFCIMYLVVDVYAQRWMSYPPTRYKPVITKIETVYSFIVMYF
ncbi:heparan-alpha-glucosaminide N-acetyltransferase-like isoform X1 [Carex littledalei]|uniref:Heparan-alpha-glucosaminide N-acetyltransferase-like isoform X1 n=1 Tax=Carex littledalei TaxID=544730 RepID=A0A833VE89_9POAL|nr:heparan-alpha-glucosaminide N-acetyltransferase-like isoform X1 [Carex littledalei]